MDAPAPLSRQAIDDFKAAHREEFGVEISDDEATEMAVRLLRFFDVIMQRDLRVNDRPQAPN